MPRWSQQGSAWFPVASICLPKCPIGNDCFMWVKISVCHCRIFSFWHFKTFWNTVITTIFLQKGNSSVKRLSSKLEPIELCLLVRAEDHCKSPRPFRGSARYFLFQLHVCVKQSFLQILQPTLYKAMVQCRSRLENPVAFVSRENIIEICKI